MFDFAFFLLLAIAALIQWLIHHIHFGTPQLSRRQWYRTVYLNSEHWHQLRQKKLAQMGYRCQRCGSSEHLDVHHLNYNYLGNERLFDLQVLCRSCHKLEHGH